MDESTNSCGTRSFSCTAAADSPARADLSPRPERNGRAGQSGQRGALPAEGAALLRELDGLRAALAGAAGARPAPPGGQGDRLIVLARFLSDPRPRHGTRLPPERKAKRSARGSRWSLTPRNTRKCRGCAGPRRRP